MSNIGCMGLATILWDNIALCESKICLCSNKQNRRAVNFSQFVPNVVAILLWFYCGCLLFQHCYFYLCRAVEEAKCPDVFLVSSSHQERKEDRQEQEHPDWRTGTVWVWNRRLGGGGL